MKNSKEIKIGDTVSGLCCGDKISGLVEAIFHCFLEGVDIYKVRVLTRTNGGNGFLMGFTKEELI